MEPHAATAFESRCVDFGLSELGDSSFNEEQERGLSPELEQERQVMRPLQAEPAEHQIHPGLEEFILNGVYPKDSFQPAFMSLATTSAAQYLDVSEFPRNIVVTRDFVNTVSKVLGHVDFSDPFQKPVQWILSVQRNPSILIIVSPYDVQQLLTAIEQSEHIILHLFSPRINVGYKSLDSLDLYNISGISICRKVPRHIASLLCQFSGQLHFPSFEDYASVRLNRSRLEACQKEYYHSANRLLSDKNAFTTLRGMFRKILDDRTLGRAIVVIDAMDECEETSRELLVSFIDEASSAEELSNIKWHISSRPLSEMSGSVQDITSSTHSLLKLDGHDMSPSINRYIDLKMVQLRQKAHKKSRVDEIADKLRAQASNTYVWVALVCKELLHAHEFTWTEIVKKSPKGFGSIL
ncbi:hypothetical protein MW887_003356 [Aspergillus wentii]|nr:hypothetical protein MW887_003356 [Aspergillus wentii]